MDCTTFSYQNAFKRINSVAHGIMSLCKSEEGASLTPPSPPHAQANSIVPPTLSLPIPKVPPSFQSSEYPSHAITAISDTFFQSVHQIREMYLTKHRNLTALFHSGTPVTQLEHSAAFFERQYADQVVLLERLAVDRIQQISRRKVASHKRKPIFNQEFVPFLETYFEYNAYPSAPDRAILAKKSMMTVRQIEVWFQNHRNRAKKENKPLRRLTLDPLPHKLSLENLEEKMPFFVIPEKERKSSSHEIASPKRQTSKQSVDKDSVILFNDLRPPYAFPTSFPPSCDYEPCLTRPKKCLFPPPIWMRKPSTSRLIEHVVDIGDLINDFATKLVIRDSSLNQQMLDRAAQPLPWFTATHTTTLSAPLPALIRTTMPAVPACSSSLPTILIPPTKLNRSRSHSPQSGSKPHTQTTPNPWSQVAPLPTRASSYTSSAYRRISTSETSSSPLSRSLSPSPRGTSYSPYTRRPSSSSSGTASNVSSALTTPDLPPISLPENELSPIFISGANFQAIDDLFYNFPNTISSVDGLDIPSHPDFDVPEKLDKGPLKTPLF